MNHLLDANLSWRLVDQLQPFFQSVTHINQTNLSLPASDAAIWKFAEEQGLIIVTNDEDFLRLQAYHGFPPKVILLRLGNQATEMIAEILLKHRKHIEELVHSPDQGSIEFVAA